VALGLGPGPGLSFSLVRRLREAAWVGLGVLGLARLRTVGLSPGRLVPEE
jgi:hypothetical protein